VSLQRPTRAAFAWAEPYFTVGVTGTNGKTSTTTMAAHAMRGDGASVVDIGTLGYFIDDEPIEVPRTLGNFYRVLQRAAQQGARRAAVECTSLALADGYAKRWRFDLGVFTNLSPDHLQTHGSWEHYLAAKAQLFVHLGPGRTAVLNAADRHALFLDQAIASDVRRLWYAAPCRGPRLRAADIEAAHIDVTLGGTSVELAASEWAERLGGRLQIRLVGEVFAENALAAVAAAVTAGTPASAAVAGLAACPPVPGRFEVLARDPTVVVDYAHSPDALAFTVATARRLARDRVIVVFGAGGQSTPQKREPMGEVVGAGADVAVVTSDNPRHEDPRAIADALVSGIERGGRAAVRIELDRRRAIETAVADARAGDVVVVAGKGHETGQIVGDTTLPLSDLDEVRRIVEREG
jgi:UDP-N-acetylmuramoyl-L-alanyl-D-glutamate--2,6-diaminopimelate ligase